MCKYLGDILQTVEFGIVVEDEFFNVVYANRWITDRFGEVVGKKCHSVFPTPTSDFPCGCCPIINLLHKKGTTEFTYRQLGANGTYFELHSYLLQETYDGRRLIVEIVREITRLVKSEVEAELILMAMNASRQPKLISDENFNIVFVNAATVGLFQTPRDTLVGTNVLSFFGLDSKQMAERLGSISHWNGLVDVAGKTLSLSIEKLLNSYTHGYVFTPSSPELNETLTKLNAILGKHHG